MRYLTLVVMLITVVISSCMENNNTSNVIQGKGLSEVEGGIILLKNFLEQNEKFKIHNSSVIYFPVISIEL